MIQSYQKYFSSIDENMPGNKWKKVFEHLQPGYRDWFLKEGEFNRPSYKQCEKALKEWMPELVPIWRKLIQLVNGDDIDARLLSLYCPTPYVTGCSQAVWHRSSPSILVRNYDYDPHLSEGVLLHSKWHKTRVIAMTDCLWGVLDGINDHGLTVSLSFGGREDVGKGFGIPIVLRYVLEFCKTTTEAIEVLTKVPTHMAYNVTLLDAENQYKTLELNPLEKPVVSDIPFAVNHQGMVGLSNYSIFSKSLERYQYLLKRLHEPIMSSESFINLFEESPLFVQNHGEGFRTLYTSVYNPTWRAMECRWPHGNRIIQSFEHFEENDILVTY